MPIRRLLALWHWLNLPCREFARLSSEALDRPLTRAERCALRIHLISCVACRRFARQIGFLRDTLTKLSTCLDHDDPLPGPELPAEARQRIKRLLENP